MTTKQAYAVEGQPKIVQVTRVDGYILDDIHAFKAEWDENEANYQISTAMVNGAWKRYSPTPDVYETIEWALSHGVERIELTGKFQV